MRKQEFKVGDRVKVTYMNLKYKGSDAWSDIGKVGTIVQIWEDQDYDWPIRVGIDEREDGFSEDELTLYLEKGKQLEFAFMSE